MERDVISQTNKTETTDFNSHAHVERDDLNDMENIHVIISTHTLTWSVTEELIDGLHFLTISTHTLTWSVTIFI